MLYRLQNLRTGCRGHPPLQVHLLRRRVKVAELKRDEGYAVFSGSEYYLEVMSGGWCHTMLSFTWFVS